MTRSFPGYLILYNYTAIHTHTMHIFLGENKMSVIFCGAETLSHYTRHARVYTAPRDFRWVTSRETRFSCALLNFIYIYHVYCAASMTCQQIIDGNNANDAIRRARCACREREKRGYTWAKIAVCICLGLKCLWCCILYYYTRQQ